MELRSSAVKDEENALVRMGRDETPTPFAVVEPCEHMAQTERQQSVSHCIKCGFEAETGGDDWEVVESPGFRRMTSCPECGSTNITLRR